MSAVETIDLDNGAPVEPSEEIPLFKLDGKTYTIPSKPKASVALRYLHELRTKGEDYAAGHMLEAMLGAEAYQALMNYDDLELEQFSAVMAACQKVLLGAIEKTQGNVQRG